MAPQLRSGAALEEDLSLVPKGSQWPVTPVPGNQTLSAGLQGHQAHDAHPFTQPNTHPC